MHFLNLFFFKREVNNDDLITAEILFRYNINKTPGVRKPCFYKNPRNVKNSVTELIGEIPTEAPLIPPGLISKAEKKSSEIKQKKLEAIEAILATVYAAGRANAGAEDNADANTDDIVPDE